MTEEELVPRILTEFWPELYFSTSRAEGRYGFMYVDKDNFNNGPAILRLSHGGNIHIINQELAWKDKANGDETHVKPGEEIKFNIGDPDFKRFIPIVKSNIKLWIKNDRKHADILR